MPKAAERLSTDSKATSANAARFSGLRNRRIIPSGIVPLLFSYFLSNRRQRICLLALFLARDALLPDVHSFNISPDAINAKLIRVIMITGIGIVPP